LSGVTSDDEEKKFRNIFVQARDSGCNQDGASLGLVVTVLFHVDECLVVKVLFKGVGHLSEFESLPNDFVFQKAMGKCDSAS
jgi:hypothetical protein